MAQRIDVSPQAMCQFVNGQVDPSLWRLHTIADALGVRVRDLFRE
ncbi:MAG: helix-turn-helix domain-containing protein [Prevotella sp.]|nr:helix-turn-helix domain-containing protein [Prevotella sp.]